MPAPDPITVKPVPKTQFRTKANFHAESVERSPKSVGGGWGGPAAAAGGRRTGVEVVGHPAPFFQAADGADERDDG